MATSSHYERSAKDMNIQKIRDRANVRFFVCVCLFVIQHNVPSYCRGHYLRESDTVQTSQVTKTYLHIMHKPVVLYNTVKIQII